VGTGFCQRPEAFESEMCEIFSHMRHIKEAGQTVKDGVSQCLEAVRRHQVQVSSELLAVVTATLVLEGWSTDLDKDLNVLHLLKQMLKRHESIHGKMMDTISSVKAP
jgi:predicted unusual protein kinase regulating ubiquinone biosynthesis (AarF/ABC1/UbiB family)